MRTHELGRRAVLVALAVAMSPVAPARAGLVLTVDSEDDVHDAAPGDGRCLTAAGTCTLRAAIQEANATRGMDEVVLPAGRFDLELPGTDEDAAATGDLDLTDDIVIRGARPHGTLVNAAGIDGVLQVLSDVRAEIHHLRIFGGLSNNPFAGAGGVHNAGTLHLVDSTVVANGASVSYGTGGLYNTGHATVERTTFDSNTPTAITNWGTLLLSHVLLRYNGPGVAIASEGGSLTIVASEIAYQTGTALFCQGGPTYIERTRVHHTRPGAAALIPSGSVTVVDSIIDHNEGGGFNNDGVLRIERSTLRANSPPLDAAIGGPAGVAGVTPYTGVTNTDRTVIVDSVVLDHRGGGLYNEEGAMTLINVTVSGNSAPREGGGVTSSAVLEIRNSTITGNASRDGAGLVTYADSANSALLSNSIVAGNTGADGGPADCSGPISSEGYNVIGTGCDGLVVAAGDQVGIDPGLGPLADNGGATLTHALLPGSPAIDAGNPAAPGSSAPACPPSDQRGAGRPQGEACDVGAYEAAGGCGDGMLAFGEECDDGNTTAGDCCSALCTVEPIAGDCNGDGDVGVAELVLAIDVALTAPPVPACRAADADGDGLISVGDLLRAVRSALEGCQPA